MGQTSLDLRKSTQWALSNVNTKGLIAVSVVIFDLVNLSTQRAHRLKLRAGGLDGPLPISYSPDSSMSNYTSFTTYRPANFTDFDGAGARLISASALLWSYSSLTVWDGSAYRGKGLAFVRMSGWGASIPGAGLDHGVVTVVYGDGKPVGDIGDLETVLEINPPPSPEQLDTHVQVSLKDDSLVVILQGDVMFDFDKSDIKPQAEKPLTQAAAVIRSARRDGTTVLINGHTDDVGADDYNMALSERRARAVAQWFVTHKYLPESILRPRGYGKSQPLINKKDDASRAKNRRVEIYLVNP